VVGHELWSLEESLPLAALAIRDGRRARGRRRYWAAEVGSGANRCPGLWACEPEELRDPQTPVRPAWPACLLYSPIYP